MNDLKVWAYDDIFNPVTDLNSNFETVKNAIEALEGSSETDEQDISDLKTKVGTATLDTTAQNLSGAVNELNGELDTPVSGLKSRMTSAETNINGLQTKVGTATLNTTAQNLSGAVNELLSKGRTLDKITVIADGVKSNTELMSDLFTAIIALTQNKYIECRQLNLGDLKLMSAKAQILHNEDTSITLDFTMTHVWTNQLDVWEAYLNATTPTYQQVYVDAVPTITFIEHSLEVPVQGTEISLYYQEV